MASKRKDQFECEFCDCVVLGHQFNEYGIGVGVGTTFLFCPKCGKPVGGQRDELPAEDNRKEQ